MRYQPPNHNFLWSADARRLHLVVITESHINVALCGTTPSSCARGSTAAERPPRMRTVPAPRRRRRGREVGTHLRLLPDPFPVLRLVVRDLHRLSVLRHAEPAVDCRMVVASVSARTEVAAWKRQASGHGGWGWHSVGCHYGRAGRVARRVACGWLGAVRSPRRVVGSRVQRHRRFVRQVGPRVPPDFELMQNFTTAPQRRNVPCR